MELITMVEGKRESGLDGIPFWLQVASSETTSDKESVIVSPVNPAYTLKKKRQIKTVSVKAVSFLKRLSLVPWRSLNWVKDWVKENYFGVDC